MKNFFIHLMFLLLCCNVSYAEQYSINLYYKHYDENVEIGIGERSINIIPSVYYDTDNGFLSIISQNIIKNVNIKITNSYGQVKMDEYVDLSSTGWNAFIGYVCYGDAYKVEIQYGDICLFGFII